MTRLALVCPMCGLWAAPGRFIGPKWPIRAFERTMGGRQPNSKQGIIKIHEVEAPQKAVELVIDAHLQLAEKMGVESRPKEELGITTGLWQDPIAFFTGTAAEAFQERVPPMVGDVATFLTGLALSRVGNAVGGAEGEAAKAAGHGLLGLEGRNLAKYMLDARRQPALTSSQVPFTLVPVGGLGNPPIPSICPHCGSWTSKTSPARPIDFSKF
jgi:hypothetical protein